MVTGFAGLLAGAFSMAAGEHPPRWPASATCSTRQVERREIEEAPEEEAAELALIFKQKGLQHRGLAVAAEAAEVPGAGGRYAG